MDASRGLLDAVKRFVQASDLCEERVAHQLGLGRSDLRAINLLEDGPVSQSEIARRLGLSRPSVTTLIDRLVRRGFVERTPHPTDRRITQIGLLPAAWQELAKIYRPIGMAVTASASGLDADVQAAIALALNGFSDVMNAQPQSGAS